MDFKIDLSPIDAATLADLANMCSRLEEEFQEDPCELETLFQQLGDILREESISRQLWGGCEGLQTFDVLDKELFEPRVILAIERTAYRWAGMDSPHQFLGAALLRAFVL